MTLPALRAPQRGLSLIELLISTVIGVVVALAITGTLIRSETSQRSAVSTRESSQASARTAFVIDRAIRNAGSGFAQNWQSTFGCRLHASQDGMPVLPVAPGASTPFLSVNSGAMQVRLAPVVIGKGLADTLTETRGDVLMVMSGSAGTGGSASSVSSIADNVMVLSSTLGYSIGDLILISGGESAAGECMVQQVGRAIPTAASLTLAGRYFSPTVGSVDLRVFAKQSISVQLGNESNPPNFSLYGVGNNSTLFRYDLLKKSSDGAERAVADGVLEVRALYGVSAGQFPGRGLDAWVDPSGAEYGAEVLTGGSEIAQRRLRSIVAIKVGFILRASPADRDALAAGGAVTLFDGVHGADGSSLTYTRRVGRDDLGHRYRTVEVTIPLRNVLMATPS